jgi:hypothetical protein
MGAVLLDRALSPPSGSATTPLHLNSRSPFGPAFLGLHVAEVHKESITTMENPTTSIVIDDVTRAALNRLAAFLGVSRSAVVRQAIRRMALDSGTVTPGQLVRGGSSRSS